MQPNEALGRSANHFVSDPLELIPDASGSPALYIATQRGGRSMPWATFKYRGPARHITRAAHRPPWRGAGEPPRTDRRRAGCRLGSTAAHYCLRHRWHHQVRQRGHLAFARADIRRDRFGKPITEVLERSRHQPVVQPAYAARRAPLRASPGHHPSGVRREPRHHHGARAAQHHPGDVHDVIGVSRHGRPPPSRARSAPGQKA